MGRDQPVFLSLETRTGDDESAGHKRFRIAEKGAIVPLTCGDVVFCAHSWTFL